MYNYRNCCIRSHPIQIYEKQPVKIPSREHEKRKSSGEASMASGNYSDYSSWEKDKKRRQVTRAARLFSLFFLSTSNVSPFFLCTTTELVSPTPLTHSSSLCLALVHRTFVTHTNVQIANTQRNVEVAEHTKEMVYECVRSEVHGPKDVFEDICIYYRYILLLCMSETKAQTLICI